MPISGSAITTITLFSTIFALLAAYFLAMCLWKAKRSLRRNALANQRASRHHTWYGQRLRRPRRSLDPERGLISPTQWTEMNNFLSAPPPPLAPPQPVLVAPRPLAENRTAQLKRKAGRREEAVPRARSF